MNEDIFSRPRLDLYYPDDLTSACARRITELGLPILFPFLRIVESLEEEDDYNFEVIIDELRLQKSQADQIVFDEMLYCSIIGTTPTGGGHDNTQLVVAAHVGDDWQLLPDVANFGDTDIDRRDFPTLAVIEKIILRSRF